MIIILTKNAGLVPLLVSMRFAAFIAFTFNRIVLIVFLVLHDIVLRVIHQDPLRFFLYLLFWVDICFRRLFLLNLRFLLRAVWANCGTVYGFYELVCFLLIEGFFSFEEGICGVWEHPCAGEGIARLQEHAAVSVLELLLLKIIKNSKL